MSRNLKTIAISPKQKEKFDQFQSDNDFSSQQEAFGFLLERYGKLANVPLPEEREKSASEKLEQLDGKNLHIIYLSKTTSPLSPNDVTSTLHISSKEAENRIDWLLDNGLIEYFSHKAEEANQSIFHISKLGMEKLEDADDSEKLWKGNTSKSSSGSMFIQGRR